VRTYLRVRLTALPRQAIHVLFLDRKNQLIADERLSEGTVDQAPVYPREVLRRALELSASGVLLVHNHPTLGISIPAGHGLHLLKPLNKLPL
jgi:DNA repair protein RadC